MFLYFQGESFRQNIGKFTLSTRLVTLWQLLAHKQVQRMPCEVERTCVHLTQMNTIYEVRGMRQKLDSAMSRPHGVLDGLHANKSTAFRGGPI